MIKLIKRFGEMGIQAARKRKSSSADKFKSFVTLLSMEISALGSGSKRMVQKNIEGFTVYGYKYSTLSYLYSEVFLKKEYEFNYSRPNPVIFDCGANIGFAALYLKRKYPQAKIFSFEPNPFAFEMLKKNVEANGLDVNCLNIGVADEHTTLDFYISEAGSLMGSVLKERGTGEKYEVKVEKLSDYITQHRPDLIKIDIEGAEAMVIKDLVASGTIGMPSEYIIEFHHNLDKDLKLAGFLAEFEKAGYEYSLKTDFNKPGDFQDILIHFFKPGTNNKATA